MRIWNWRAWMWFNLLWVTQVFGCWMFWPVFRDATMPYVQAWTGWQGTGVYVATCFFNTMACFFSWAGCLILEPSVVQPKKREPKEKAPKLVVVKMLQNEVSDVKDRIINTNDLLISHVDIMNSLNDRLGAVERAEKEHKELHSYVALRADKVDERIQAVEEADARSVMRDHIVSMRVDSLEQSATYSTATYDTMKPHITRLIKEMLDDYSEK